MGGVTDMQLCFVLLGAPIKWPAKAYPGAVPAINFRPVFGQGEESA